MTHREYILSPTKASYVIEKHWMSGLLKRTISNHIWQPLSLVFLFLHLYFPLPVSAQHLVCNKPFVTSIIRDMRGDRCDLSANAFGWNCSRAAPVQTRCTDEAVIYTFLVTWLFIPCILSTFVYNHTQWVWVLAATWDLLTRLLNLIAVFIATTALCEKRQPPHWERGAGLRFYNEAICHKAAQHTAQAGVNRATVVTFPELYIFFSLYNNVLSGVLASDKPSVCFHGSDLQ